MELLSWSSFKTSSDAGPSVACHRYQPERRTLIAGLADGHLAYWTRRKDGGSQGSSDAKPFLLHAHAGGVRCVLLVESEGLGLEGCLLFTGGGDCTIRVWRSCFFRLCILVRQKMKHHIEKKIDHE